jgi:hypothetical protein
MFIETMLKFLLTAWLIELIRRVNRTDQGDYWNNGKRWHRKERCLNIKLNQGNDIFTKSGVRAREVSTATTFNHF